MKKGRDIFKRIIIISTFNFLTLFLLVFSVFKISRDEKLECISNEKNFFKLKIKNIRGMIYDCRGIPLINTERQILAAVVPEECNFDEIINYVPDAKKENFKEKFKKNVPFVTEMTSISDIKGVKIFNVMDQKFDSCFLCHVLGYVSEGHGVCGIEKSFDKLLNSCNDIEIEYQKNALGKIIFNDKNNIMQLQYTSLHGVQLCIDKRIQEIAEEISKKYISNGAIIITEVPNCKIRASVSLPQFSRNSIKNLLKSNNSDLVNKVNSQYNLGSIFKLVTSACIIEKGTYEDLCYSCHGSFRFEDGSKINCFNGIPHGNINLEYALSLSCNSMFANFSKYIDPEYYLDVSHRLGFGESVELSPDIVTSKGNLPSKLELENNKKIAMFSFGQGSLMATPIQVASLINLIASGGIYSQPKLVEKIINTDGTFEHYHVSLPKRVLKFETAKKLKKFMKSSIDFGTSKYGNPEKISAGAKTSTAETGMILNGKRVNQSWFAGFFPFENPKYSIVILAENVDSGGKICGPIFKEISDKISELI